MNKMVITGNDKLFVTNDATTILRELDVFHPAARLVLMNSTRLQEEVRSDFLTQKPRSILIKSILCGLLFHLLFLTLINFLAALLLGIDATMFRLVMLRTLWCH